MICLLVIMGGAGCREKEKERPSVQSQVNQTISQVGNGSTGGDAAFRDLMGSIGKKVDEVAKDSAERQKILEQTLKDYENDRKEIQGVFSSIADRLDQVDKSISSLQNKYQEIDRNFKDLNAVGNNKGSE